MCSSDLKFEIALKETPNDPIVIYGMASMLDRKGNYDRLIELVEPIKNHSNPKTREACLAESIPARG